MSQTARPDQHNRIQAAFDEDERDSMRLAGLVRAIATIAIAIWVAIENSDLERSLWYGGWILLLALSGLVMSWLAHTQRYRGWMKYPMAAFDAVVFVCIVMVPVPFEPHLWPRQLQLTHGTAIYAMVILLSGSFIYSPRFALWNGAVLALCWLVGNLWVMGRDDTVFLHQVIDPEASWDEFLIAITHPYMFHTGHLVRDMVVLLSSAAILAAAVRRVRGLVHRQVRAERQRASLARYFSPNLVESLASRGDVLAEERRQPVGVLFVDIIGFTAFCESREPAEVIALLREFQRRVEGPVFAHGGTLDKFIGDAVMATFGTPDAGRHDAANTLLCVRAVMAAMDAWSKERKARGSRPVRVGIGAHYGPCVVGDVGGERRLEFTVIGDTVNVASRLEGLTRSLDARAVVSDDLVAAASRDGGDAVRDGLIASPPVEIRGRSEPLSVWTLK